MNTDPLSYLYCGLVLGLAFFVSGCHSASESPTESKVSATEPEKTSDSNQHETEKREAKEKAEFAFLVEPEELSAQLKNESLVVIDARSLKAWQNSHIPGAVSANVNEWKTLFSQQQDEKVWSQRIGELGIDQETSVVIYDDPVYPNSGRLWWLLNYWGVKEVKLLHGGWKGWLKLKLPTESQSVSPVKKKFVAKPRSQLLISKADLLKSLKEENPRQIIDTRSLGEHQGTSKGGNKRGGAIPGAKHLDWNDLVDHKTSRLKSAEEIRKLAKEAEIDLKQPCVVHCQSGARASFVMLVLQSLGAKDVSNYYPGWSEWGNDDQTPIVTPK